MILAIIDVTIGKCKVMGKDDDSSYQAIGNLNRESWRHAEHFRQRSDLRPSHASRPTRLRVTDTAPRHGTLVYTTVVQRLEKVQRAAARFVTPRLQARLIGHITNFQTGLGPSSHTKTSRTMHHVLQSSLQLCKHTGTTLPSSLHHTSDMTSAQVRSSRSYYWSL